MPEQLPDGFEQKDVQWDAWGAPHPVIQVDRISQKQRDAFTHTGVEFDGFVEAEARNAAEQDLEQSVLEAMRNMDPTLKMQVE